MLFSHRCQSIKSPRVKIFKDGSWPDLAVHAFKPSIRRQRQADLFEFQDNTERPDLKQNKRRKQPSPTPLSLPGRAAVLSRQKAPQEGNCCQPAPLCFQDGHTVSPLWNLGDASLYSQYSGGRGGGSLWVQDQAGLRLSYRSTLRNCL